MSTPVWHKVSLRQVLGLKHPGTVKIAFSLKDLVQLTSDWSVSKAPNCTSTVLRTDPSTFLLVYKVRCREKYSSAKGHIVRVKFDPKRVTLDDSVDSLDVRLSCDCEAFLYWGAQWNLSTGDALYGQPRPLLQAPKDDPRRHQFVLCKHCKVVADRVFPVILRTLERIQQRLREEEQAKQDDKKKDSPEQEAEES